MASRFLAGAFSAALAGCGGAPAAPVTLELAPASSSPSASAITSATVPKPRPIIATANEDTEHDRILMRTGDGAPAGDGGGPTRVITVQIIAPVVSPGRIADAQPVVAGMAPAFRRCVKHALSVDHTSVAGRASAHVIAQVDSRGGVVSSAFADVVGLPKTTLDCIADRLAVTQFAPPDGGSATIVIPVKVSLH